MEKKKEVKYEIPQDFGEMSIRDRVTKRDIPEPSAERLRELLKKHGLTGGDAAKIVGVNSRTIRKWTGGERGIPSAAWKLLLLAMWEI